MSYSIFANPAGPLVASMSEMSNSCIMDTGLLILESTMDAGVVDRWTFTLCKQSPARCQVAG